MVTEPPYTLDVNGTVVDPDALQDGAGSGGPLAEKVDLVYQVDDVAHCAIPSYQRMTTGMPWLEFAWSATTSVHREVVSATPAKACVNAEMYRSTESRAVGLSGKEMVTVVFAAWRLIQMLIPPWDKLSP